MKLKRIILSWGSLFLLSSSYAQPNCFIITDSACARACRVFVASDSFYQGSPKCQYYLDSAIWLCPSFADAWHEKSVPYLKRGDFVTWRKYMDEAVRLNPARYLSVRGWCRFKFLQDYEGALDDLQRNDTLSRFAHQYSGDGNYELHILMALCERGLGNFTAAFHYFHEGIDSVVARNGPSSAGLFSYLHLGVTLLQTGDYDGALVALESENKQYDRFAETYYYMGMAHLRKGHKAAALENFRRALELYTDKTGTYRLNDPYCEMPDAIYVSDILSAISQAE